jgi:CRISPR/Cas system CMR-associated protein Cmr5 small subunit
MKAVNNLLPAADKAVENYKDITERKGDTIIGIKEIYKNYTAQLCVSIVQAGLLPALAYFREDTDSKDGKSSYVLHVVAKTLGYEDADKLIEKVQSPDTDKASQRLLKQKVVNAAIALKIILKTYPIIKKEDHE